MTLILAAYSIGGIANAILFYLIKIWTDVLIYYYLVGVALFGTLFFLLI